MPCAARWALVIVASVSRDHILPLSNRIAAMSRQSPPQNDEYAEYDPLEGLPIIGSNTAVAATGAKINTHVPTPEEIASRKYVIRRHWSGPRWVRWLFGTDEYSPK